MGIFGGKNINTLEDLLHHELRDLYSAEDQLTAALPKMAEKANHENLKLALQNHLEETRNQTDRLKRVGEMLSINLDGNTCEAMEGLIKEGKEVMDFDGDKDVRDAGLIGAAQRVEHYEMAAYGTAISLAHQLGKNDVASILEETLEEEKKADKKLTTIATERVNKDAHLASNHK